MNPDQGLMMLLKAARYREYIDSLNKQQQFEKATAVRCDATLLKRQLDYSIYLLDKEFSLTELKFACPDKK